MFAFSMWAPLRIQGGRPLVSRASLAIAATLWLSVVAALAFAWLALPAQRTALDNAACESLGRAGMRCSPDIAEVSPVADCLTLGKGGRICTK